MTREEAPRPKELAGIPEESGLVLVRRGAAWTGRLFRWQVALDRQVIGHLRNGQTMTLAVPSGQHRLAIRRRDGGSRSEVAFHLGAGSFIEMSVTPNDPSGGGGPLWPARPLLRPERLGSGSWLVERRANPRVSTA